MAQSMPVAPSIPVTGPMGFGFIGDGNEAVDLDNQEAYGAGMVLDKVEE